MRARPAAYARSDANTFLAARKKLKVSPKVKLCWIFILTESLQKENGLKLNYLAMARKYVRTYVRTYARTLVWNDTLYNRFNF